MTPPADDAALRALRERFDGIDDQIVALIAARLRLADEAAVLKRALGRSIADPTREAVASARRRNLPSAAGIEGVVDDVYAVLVAASRARQGRLSRPAS